MSWISKTKDFLFSSALLPYPKNVGSHLAFTDPDMLFEFFKIESAYPVDGDEHWTERTSCTFLVGGKKISFVERYGTFTNKKHRFELNELKDYLFTQLTESEKKFLYENHYNKNYANTALHRFFLSKIKKKELETIQSLVFDKLVFTDIQLLENYSSYLKFQFSINNSGCYFLRIQFPYYFYIIDSKGNLIPFYQDFYRKFEQEIYADLEKDYPSISFHYFVTRDDPNLSKHFVNTFLESFTQTDEYKLKSMFDNVRINHFRLPLILSN